MQEVNGGEQEDNGQTQSEGKGKKVGKESKEKNRELTKTE
jgi:hypothetical protein